MCLTKSWALQGIRSNVSLLHYNHSYVGRHMMCKQNLARILCLQCLKANLFLQLPAMLKQPLCINPAPTIGGTFLQ